MELPIKSTNKEEYVTAVIDEDDPVYNQYEELLADMQRGLEKIRDELHYVEQNLAEKELADDVQDCIDGVCQLILLTE